MTPNENAIADRINEAIDLCESIIATIPPADGIAALVVVVASAIVNAFPGADAAFIDAVLHTFKGQVLIAIREGMTAEKT